MEASPVVLIEKYEIYGVGRYEELYQVLTDYSRFSPLSSASNARSAYPNRSIVRMPSSRRASEFSKGGLRIHEGFVRFDRDVFYGDRVFG